MVEQFQNFQSLVGPTFALLIPLIVGFVGGIGLSAVAFRREQATTTPPTEEPEKSNEDQESEEAVINWEKKDARRSPRRSGRICEVMVALPGETDFPQQGLVLNRSVGGLGILVSNEYPPGTVLGVLPTAASKL